MDGDCDTLVEGSKPRPGGPFAEAGFRYRSYWVSQRVNPAADFESVLELVRPFRAERPDIVHVSEDFE